VKHGDKFRDFFPEFREGIIYKNINL
jgi:hypothetical protein